MRTQRLVVEGTDPEHFFLSLQAGTLTVGGDAAHPEIVVSSLRVVRFHYELELEEAPIEIAGKELQPNQIVEFGHLRLGLIPGEEESAEPAAETATNDDVPELSKRLLVIDGADHGRAFGLNVSGKTAIGNNSKFADIVLHDLYVARLHCELHVDGDQVVVKHIAGKGGTLINGKEITEAELNLGDILRIGNTHMRYDLGVADPVTNISSDKEGELPGVVGINPGDSAILSRSKVHSVPSSVVVDPLLKLEGQALGHYQIEAILGHGQSGVVFRAEDRKTGQTVTLKVLAPEFPADDGELQSFVRSIKQVAPLRHTHLVSLFAAGKTGAFCWLAREYVDGESLAMVIERLGRDSKLSWKRACRVAMHLAKILDFLEQKQVVHGNLTPANILVESSSKTTKLADLMLDKAISGSRLAGTIREKKQLADLPYRAPEQLDSEAPVDHCSNIFSLGALLYSLISGRPPFRGTSSKEIVRQMNETKLYKPSHYVREIPAPFEAAVLKMLARNREDRFQNAAETLAAIEPIANMHEIG